jgi:1-acyl-sn-glycerol-3-phosphate acyltransferase
VGPLLPDTGPRGPRYLRRLRGIVVETTAFVVVTVTLPLLLLVAAVVDLVLGMATGKPWMGVRLVAMLWWFLLGELRGMIGLTLINLASFGRDTRKRRFRVYRLRQIWASGHLAGARRLFRLDFDVQGLDRVAPGPVLIFIRHTSIVDNVMPDAVVGRATGIGLRFVLKRDLQLIPTIDIGGRWVPTSFVRRASGDTARELDDLRRLGMDLDPHEGVLVYPEGTRFTPDKLAAAQALIAERQPEVAPYANKLRHVLPPRLGGPLALLEQMRGTDVVFCGHVGLDGFEYISDIWRGGLIGGTVRVMFWRYPAADVPTERDALIAWLYEHWQIVDDWVAEHRPDGESGRVVVAV